MNITVVAAPGLICPRENPSEPKITDSEPVAIESSTYYNRLLRDGSLKLYTEPAEPKEKKAK